jgi:hypothetical protein
MLQRLLPAVLTLVISGVAWTQDPAADPGSPPGSSAIVSSPPAGSAAPTAPVEDKRVFGVIPNNRTTEGSLPFQPISAKRKMTIAAKDSFDWPVYITSGLFASLYQLEDQNHSFGQGMAGYGKRYATSYGDQVIGNMMTEGILPSLTHEDPRYFRVGQGTKKSRLVAALTQIVVTRTDSGGKTFNFSEWGGNALAVAVGNAWYPDTRDVSDNVQKLLIQCATDAFSNVLKEFWPDVKQHFLRKREVKRERELRQLTTPDTAQN